MRRLKVFFIRLLGKIFGKGLDKSPSHTVSLDNNKPTNERQQMETTQNDVDFYNSLIASRDSEIAVLSSACSNLRRKVSEVSEIVEGLIKDETITDPEVISDLCRALDLEIMRTVEVTLSAEVTLSVEVPYGDEISEYDFDITEVQYNGDAQEITDYSVVTLDVNE